MMKLICLAVGIALLAFVSEAEAGKKMVCYYGAWSPYRPGNGKFDIENIDPFICTHLVYGFTALNMDATIKVYDPWQDLPDDWGKAGYRRFNDLKKVNPSLKTLVAIGGWNEGSEKYSQVFADAGNRARFVADAVQFVKKYGFDGLDMDWEYPGQRGGVPTDVAAFTELLKALRTEFNKHGLLLTAAVAAAEFSFSQSYDIPALGQYLDMIHIMAYDYHGAWENITGHNAPLYMSQIESGTEFAGYNADSSIQAWLRYGGNREKMIMGVGLYGRSFTLSSPSCVTPRCPVSGPGKLGPATGEAGMLGYHEICQNEATGTKYWDDEAKSAYLVFGGDQWVGYDDEQSARLKVDYIKNNNLGGAMVWSIDTDDFRGLCGKGKYPILSILKAGMDGATNTAPTTAAPTTAAPTTAAPTTAKPTTAAPTTAAPTTAAPTTAAPTTAAPTTAAPTTAAPTTAAPATTAAPSSSEPCSQVGYNRDATNCAVFYQCSLNNGKWSYTKFTCSGGLLFDSTKNVCNYANQVQC